jgi:hypothetical protein
VDVENFINGAAKIGLPIDLSKVIDRLREMGSVIVRKAYGDMQKALQAVNLGHQYQMIRNSFYSNLVDIEDVPYVTLNKNTADIKLVVEALSVAFQNEFITHFAILASDRDYVPLYQKLKTLNKTVLTIGVDRQHINPTVIGASDRAFYYEHLFLGDNVNSFYESEEESVVTRRKEYLELLSTAVRNLSRTLISVSAERILEALHHAKSDFNFGLIGCETFSQFLRLGVEGGYIVEDEDDGTYSPNEATLRPTPQPQTKTEEAPSRAIGDEDAKKEAKIYENILCDSFNFKSFPNRAYRNRVLNGIHSAMQRNFGVTVNEALGGEEFQREESLTFKDITDRVAAEMETDGYEPFQNVIYKTIVGLYFRRCFFQQAREGDFQIASIKVIGIAKPLTEWEDELHRGYINKIESVLHKPMQDYGIAYLLFEKAGDEDLRRVDFLRSRYDK